VHSRPIENIP